MADTIKLGLAALILATGIGAFYFLADQLMVVRVLAMLVATGLAAYVAAQSAPGAHAVDFGRGAVVEIRKVVWPTRKETTQTTLVVMVMVVIMGIILWLFDLLLGSAVQMLTGHGG